MGTSNTEFSLLISAFSLNSTWTPVVGGLLASKLGTTYTSILATGVIFLGIMSPWVFLDPWLMSHLGQILLLIGEVTESLRLMAFGLFVFGLGVSPLAVVQETIIVRFFRSHGLGVSMALGLVAGKGASFVSARTSYPLSERYGRDAPFYVATCLAGLSVIINLMYILTSKWLIRSTGVKLEASEIQEEARNGSLSLSEARALQKVAEKRRVDLKEVTKLDDVFWA
jgi:MFS family permease